MQIDKNELCNSIKQELKNELTAIAFNTWIKNLEIYSIDDNHIVFEAFSEFQKDCVEKRYADLILNTLIYITNRDWTFSVKFNELNEEDDVIASKSIENENKNKEDEICYNNSSLNPKYTFDTFVVGNYNRFAHAAAFAVGEAPYVSYNPLFIYGGVGLGKTHLLHAIGNKILSNNKKTKILYVTSEKFTNQLINALVEAKMETFRNRYRNIDVLLIDDIQFIARKRKNSRRILPYI